MSASSIDNVRSILFVCTGNICRSPLAEYLFRDHVEKLNDSGRFRIGSAGTYALNGNRATPEAMEAGRMWGIDLSPHRAREVNGALLAASDFVLVMTRGHRDWLLQQYPAYENKIYLAMLFPRKLAGEASGSADVPDPIGESVDYYLEVLEMLEPVLPEIYSGALEEGDS